jgi:hypothetical protein
MGRAAPPAAFADNGALWCLDVYLETLRRPAQDARAGSRILEVGKRETHGLHGVELGADFFGACGQTDARYGGHFHFPSLGWRGFRAPAGVAQGRFRSRGAAAAAKERGVVTRGHSDDFGSGAVAFRATQT